MDTSVAYHYPMLGHARDDDRDSRQLGTSTRAAINLQADLATIIETKHANPDFKLYGQAWAVWCRSRGWHPAWASAVATAYGRWLAESAGVDQDAARQAALAEWQEHLRWLRGLDPEKVGGVPGAIAECLRQIQTLIGVKDEPEVKIQLHAAVTVDDLATMSDDELRARYAKAIEAEATASEATDLGGGSAEGNPAARSPEGSPTLPLPPSHPKKGNPSAPTTGKPLGVCPGCGIRIREGKSWVPGGDGYNWHPGCLRRHGDG